jgi:hypothetical protein
MPAPGYGHKGFIQLGKETVYGTAVTTTVKLELIDEKLKLNRVKIDDQSLTGNLSRRAPYEGPRWITGSFIVRANFEGMLEIFRGVFGSFTAPAPFDTPARDQTFKEFLTLPSYTLEVNKGDIPAGKCFRYLGCKFISLNVKGVAGTGTDAIVTFEVGVIGQDMLSNQTPASLSFPATFPVKFDHDVFVDDGTTDVPPNVRIRNFEIMFDNPHTAEERLYMGSLLIDEPLRKDWLACTWKFTEEFFTRTAYDAYKAGTLLGPRIIFRHPTFLVSRNSALVTVNAGTTITRAAGSFVADGWQVGDSFDPTAPAAPFIPTGAYVTNVVALTLTVDLTCTSSGGTTTIAGGACREIELRSNFATLTTDPLPGVNGFGSLIANLEMVASRDDATDLAALVGRIRSSEAALT